MTIGSIQITWQLALLAVAVTQWLVFVIAGIASKKAGSNLLFSSIGLALTWIILFAAPVMATAKPATETIDASMTGKTPKASCASLKVGMTSAEVRDKMGDPDEVVAEDETRGPGAEMMIYRNSRCAVHVFNSKVDFID
ncbi:MAG TPA: hypothetical protein VF618_11410 [Thermoanaerobaculia bacterium]